MTQTTKDNIAEVLKCNGFHEFRIWKDKCGITLGSKQESYSQVGFNNPKWLQIIEAHVGEKLKPLPEPNPFNKVKIGQWVRNGDTWYQLISITHDGYYNFRCGSFGILSSSAEGWDLSNIRDYNPDKEIMLKVGDKIVTKFGRSYTIARFDYDQSEVKYKTPIGGYDHFKIFTENDDGYIKSVNGKRGKLVIPEFDFEKTLLDAGYKTDGKLIHSDPVVESGYPKPTLQNAARLIQIKKLIDEIEVEK